MIKNPTFPLKRQIAPGNTPVQGRAKQLDHADVKRMVDNRKMPGKVHTPPKRPRKGDPKIESFADDSSIPAQFDIPALADALDNDADKIYQYVASRIEFLPTFGSQKGALGCLIDRLGNSFDQSALMVQLLTEAGYTAKIMFGELRITAAAAAAWLGTSAADAWSSRNLLANGAIPAAVEYDAGTSTYYVVLSHCWVKCTISGTAYYFDPSRKTYNVTAPIDLETVSGYNSTSFESACFSGATVTSDYVQNVNTANMTDELDTMATNLVDWIGTNKPDATVDDIIGGRKIVPVTSVLRNTSLSDMKPGSTPTEWTTVPNTYKTVFSVLYDTISESFYSEDIVGKRLSITFNGSLEAELRLDGALLGTSTAQLSGSYNSVLLTVEHPYGFTWADQSFWQTVWAGKPYLIAQSWGNTTKQMAFHHRRILNDNIYAGGDENDENVVCESLSVLWHNWAAQKSIMASMIGRLNECVCVLHHQIGLVGHYDGPFMDLGGIMWSSSALDNDYGRIYSTDTMLALRGVGFESNSINQVPNIEAVSSDVIMDTANAAGQKLFKATSSNWTSTVRPALINWDSGVLDDIENWYINNGWNILIHEDGSTFKSSFEGFGYYAVGQYGGTIGIVNGYLHGVIPAEFQTPGEMVSQSSQNKNQSQQDNSGHVSYEGTVDGFTGQARGAAEAIHVGSESLSLVHNFDNRYRSEFTHIGYGWRHQYLITAERGNDGFAALGDETAAAAAANMVFILVGILQLNGGFGNNFVLSSLGTLYASKKLTNNAVHVRDGQKQYTFVELMDGTYLPPKGVGLGLVYSGGVFIMENYDGDRWTFRTDGHIEKIEYKRGETITFTYTGLDRRLTGIASNIGHTLTLSYGSIGGLVSYLTQITDESLQSVNYDIDVANGFKLKRFQDKAGQWHEYFYDSKGRLTTKKRPDGFSSVSTFDDQDRVLTQTDEGGHITTFKYDGNYTIMQRGNRIVWTFMNKDGKPENVQDGALVTNYSYDGLGRQTLVSIYGGTTTSFEYDSFHRMTKKTIIGSPDLVETWGYTGSFTTWTTHTDARGNTTTRVLNAQGLISTETGPTVGGSSPVSTWTYDTFGRVITFTDPTGLVTQYNYGAGNFGKHLTSEVHDYGGLNLTTSYTYDDVGNRLTVTNPRGHTTTFTYDFLRRPLTKTDPSPFNYVTEWQYDSNNNKLLERRLIGPIWQTQTWTYSLTNKVLTHTDFLGKVTTNTYDTFDRLATTTDAEGRVTQFFYDFTNRLSYIIDSNNVTSEQRTYTNSGQLYQLTDARSNVTTYSYDQYDRKYRCTYPGSSYEQWDYDANGNVTTFTSRSGDNIVSTFDALNRLATRTPQGQATETFTYDLAGRLLTASTPTVSGNPASGSFSRGYDSAKRLTSETNPQSQVVSYQLDANGNTTRVTYPDSYYVEKVYDQLNRLTDIKLNGSSSSAAVFAYDALSRRVSLTYLNGVVQNYYYDYGNNLTAMNLIWSGNSASWSYGYNNDDEMTGQSCSDGAFIWHPASGGTVTYGTANSLNQYPTVGGVSRTMNSDGCLTGDGTWTYTYDGDNMMTQASKTGVTVNFVYNPFHRNIRKDDGTNKTRYIYAGDHIVAEYNDTTNALLNRYIYGYEADDPIIQVTTAGVVTYNSQDHIGSIIARTDSSGNALGKYKYSPFGESLSGSLSGTIFGFTGQRFDSETGLYHFKARYYDPVTGRFLQPDPIGYGDGLNLYRYAGNSPMRTTDPTGTAGWEDFLAPYADEEAHKELFATAVYVGLEAQYFAYTGGASAGRLQNATSELGRVIQTPRFTRAFARGRDFRLDTPVVTQSRSQHPEIVKDLEQYLNSGSKNSKNIPIFNADPHGADTRRKWNMKASGLKIKSGFDRHETPAASLVPVSKAQMLRGYVVKYQNQKENRSHGTSLGRQLQNKKTIRLKIVD